MKKYSNLLLILFLFSCSKDIDLRIIDGSGNTYDAISIGNQVWLQQNLKTKKYLNGDNIATIDPYKPVPVPDSDPKYYWVYNNSDSLAAIYGLLYTQSVANDSRQVCPKGFHIPSQQDWQKLFDNLGKGLEVLKLMEYMNKNALTDTNQYYLINDSKFYGKYGGLRHEGSIYIYLGDHQWDSEYRSTFDELNYKAYFLCSDPLKTLQILNYGYKYFIDLDKNNGASIRCIKN